MLFLPLLLAVASQSGPYTERVSLNSAEFEGNAPVTAAVFCADGRYVAFVSVADNLVNGDANGLADVFLRARHADRTIRVSVDSLGAEANGVSRDPSLAADGRYVAFASDANNLVANDANGTSDVFVHDIVSGMTVRVSVDSLGLEANGASERPSITGDGRYVAFESDASNLVAVDANGARDVFVHDLWTGLTERLSVASGGAEAVGTSTGAALSLDGRFLVFQSDAANLVPNDANGFVDVFLHDRMTGLTERVSVDSSGAEANGISIDAIVSTDGFTVAFTSLATNLVPGDTNGVADVLIRDRRNGLTERMSVDSSGAQASGPSSNPSLIPDGSIIAFESLAPDLVAGDTNGWSDVFLRMRGTNETERISLRNAGGQSNAPSYAPSCAVDARVVTFMSDATNLVPGDTNLATDAFVRNRGFGNAGTATTLVLTVQPRLAVGDRVLFQLLSIAPGNPWWLIGGFNDGGTVIFGHPFEVGPQLRLLAQGHADGRGVARWTTPPLPPALSGRTIFVQAGVYTVHQEVHESNLIERSIQ